MRQRDSSKTHNCPNCNCNSKQIGCEQYIVSKPISPVMYINRMASPSHCQYVYTQIKPIPQETAIIRQRIAIKRNIPQNIYFCHPDRVDSNNSVSSRKSFTSRNSKEKNIINIVTSPNKPNVSFRYTSPTKQQIQNSNTNVKINQQTPIKTNNIYYEQHKPSLYHVKSNQIIKPPSNAIRAMSPINNFMEKHNEYSNQLVQDQPKKPSILSRKKSIENRKDKSKSVAQFPPLILQQKKSSNELTSNQSIIDAKGLKELINSGKSLHDDFLVEQEKSLAYQLFKDLKLNYDYYQTADISKSQNN